LRWLLRALLSSRRQEEKTEGDALDREMGKF
jgi:hypothetical protein